jgi:hypothetical protein
MEPDYEENNKILAEHDNPLLWIAAFGVIIALMIIWIIFFIFNDNRNSDISFLSEVIKNIS